jgi:hypothetical protein
MKLESGSQVDQRRDEIMRSAGESAEAAQEREDGPEDEQLSARVIPS